MQLISVDMLHSMEVDHGASAMVTQSHVGEKPVSKKEKKKMDLMCVWIAVRWFNACGWAAKRLFSQN